MYYFRRWILNLRYWESQTDRNWCYLWDCALACQSGLDCMSSALVSHRDHADRSIKDSRTTWILQGLRLYQRRTFCLFLLWSYKKVLKPVCYVLFSKWVPALSMHNNFNCDISEDYTAALCQLRSKWLSCPGDWTLVSPKNNFKLYWQNDF